MLFIAVLCILLGMTGLCVCGLVLAMRISEHLTDADYGDPVERALRNAR